ncbi:D-alanyl-D-alanine carboxypeptidase [Pedobacter sp. AW31-3R]|uniref:D-alanyl-D-alanine carboxypeptidase n=1 Tax=Pedobacter sp. AW31-3R TaxID=3445781 RepID=UPI003FA04DD0
MYGKQYPHGSILFCLFFPLLYLCQGCSADRQIARKVNRVFEHSVLNDAAQVGFALSGTENDRIITDRNSHKYFTPASNAKLLTFYAALKMIPDTMPALRYIERGDSLIFWGTGDPSFLHTRLKGVAALNFLKNSGKQLFFSPGRYTGNFYGLGWAWDDYNDFEQAEITELPLTGNVLNVLAGHQGIVVSPRLFKDCFIKDSLSAAANFRIVRQFNTNEFNYPAVSVPEGFSAAIPYKTSTAITLNLLSDTLKLPVQLIHLEMPPDAKTVSGLKTDEVLREMMLPSDNFIAEQLLLVCSNQFQQALSGDDAISYIKKQYLSTLPDPPRWVDGSGLSRMNLVSPADMVTLLGMIYKEVNNRERLFGMLAAGGKTGTLKNAYPATDQPFIFGKTGTLSNNYNQSGYVVTKKGRVLVFSFMNNHFLLPVAEVKKEMARIMTYIHDHF